MSGGRQHCVIPYGRWRPIALQWVSINFLKLRLYFRLLIQDVFELTEILQDTAVFQLFELSSDIVNWLTIAGHMTTLMCRRRL